ncbi:MAG TPA: DUF4956 domain-containing protein [Paludibacteraceae bacterium]|nr:DUF4956 domain-containing protein [Paludibacteraceae bacterium]
MIQTEQYPEFDPSIAKEFGFSDTSTTLDFLGVPLFDADSILNLLIRFSFNLLVCWIIVHFFYYKKSKRRDYYVTFILFSTTMFLLIFLMENVKLQIGFTLGLFAIFGMIRYRTETVPIREMTYLFVIIGISVINGLAMTVSYAELVLTNFLLIALTWVLESQRILKHTSTKLILYEKIDLVVPDKRPELLADLEKRTGLKIDKIEIGHIDFLRDVAFIKLYYILEKGENNSIDNITKINQYNG